MYKFHVVDVIFHTLRKEKYCIVPTELKDDRMENGIIGRRIVHNLH